MLEKKGK